MGDPNPAYPGRLVAGGGPSPLASALAQAVLDAHAKRAGQVPSVGAMSGVMEGDKGEETSGGATASERREQPVLRVIEGGRGTHTEP
jgi:hypothetical protein